MREDVLREALQQCPRADGNSRCPRTQHHLIVHLARDVNRRKKAEEATEKVLEVSRQLYQVATQVAPAAAPVSPLSEQELHVLRLFSAGKNSPEIAGTLGISLQTLRNHLHHVNQKLRTHNRLEAVTHAIQRKLI